MAGYLQKLRAPRRRTLFAWVMLGFALPMAHPVWLLLRPPQPIRISPEITYRTEPVHANGYVDLTDEWNERLRKMAGHARPLDVNAVNRAAADYELAATSSEKRRAAAELIRVIRTEQGVIEMPPITKGSMWMQSKLPALRSQPETWRWVTSLAEEMETAILTSTRNADSAGVYTQLRDSTEVLRFLMRHNRNDFYGCGPWQELIIKGILTATIRKSITCKQAESLVKQLPDIRFADVVNILRIYRIRRMVYLFAQHAREIQTTDLSPVANRSWGVRMMLACIERREYGGIDWNEALTALNQRYSRREGRLALYCRGLIPADCLTTDASEASDDRLIVWSWRTSDAQFTELFCRQELHSVDTIVTRLFREWLNLQRRLALARASVCLMHCAAEDRFPEKLSERRLAGHSNVVASDLRYEKNADHVRLGLFGDSDANWLCEWNRNPVTGEWVFSARHGRIPDWTLQP